MTRLEALNAAEAYVTTSHPSARPLKSNGYPVDGWRPIPPEDGVRLVLKVAAFLLGEPEDL